VAQKNEESQELENRFTLLEQSSVQYRNEINFWNGKCSTLKRDLDYQEKYLQKYKEENGRLMNENDYLVMKTENTDKEVQLLRKQVNGL
jgi:chromosome segregation ATPase